MRNEEGLWNDGLDFDTCLNNNEVRSNLRVFMTGIILNEVHRRLHGSIIR